MKRPVGWRGGTSLSQPRYGKCIVFSGVCQAFFAGKMQNSRVLEGFEELTTEDTE